MLSSFWHQIHVDLTSRKHIAAFYFPYLFSTNSWFNNQLAYFFIKDRATSIGIIHQAKVRTYPRETDFPPDSIKIPSVVNTLFYSLSFLHGQKLLSFLNSTEIQLFSKAALWDILKAFSRLYHLFVCHKEMQAKSQAISNS